MREGRILRSHGKSPALAREQLPPQQQQPLLLTRQQVIQEEKEAKARGTFVEAECRAVSPHQLEKTRDDYYLEHVADEWTGNRKVWLTTKSHMKWIEKTRTELELHNPHTQHEKNKEEVGNNRRPLYHGCYHNLASPCETSVRGALLRQGVQTGADNRCRTKAG